MRLRERFGMATSFFMLGLLALISPTAVEKAMGATVERTLQEAIDRRRARV